MAFPVTLFEFQARFPDELCCWAYLRKVRWRGGFRCPRCEGRRRYALARRELVQCAICGYQASLTAGTILHGTRVALRIWFLAIFFLGRHKQGIAALQLQRDTGLGSYRTAWLLLHKVRSTLGPDPGHLITGRVEADETYVGAPHEKGRRGGRAFGRKRLVGVVVERRRAKGQARLGVLRSHTFLSNACSAAARAGHRPGRVPRRTEPGCASMAACLRPVKASCDSRPTPRSRPSGPTEPSCCAGCSSRRSSARWSPP